MIETKRVKLIPIFVFYLFTLTGCNQTFIEKNTPDAFQKVDEFMATAQRLENEALDYSNQSDNPYLTTALYKDSDAIELPVHRISIQAEDMDIRDFYMSLVEGTTLNMVIDPEVEGKISLVVHDMSVEQILDILEEQNGYAWHTNQKGYKISANNTETRSYNISYLALSRSSSASISVDSSRISSDSESANTTEIKTKHESDVFSELRSSVEHLIKDDGSANYQINTTSGLLVLRGYPKTHRLVSNFLQQLNKNLHHQVLIEAKILEVDLFESYSQGIDWATIFNKEKFAMGQVGSGSIVNGVDTIFGSSSSSAANLSGLTDAGTSGFDKFLYDSLQSTQMGGIFKLGLFGSSFNFVMDLLAGQGNVQVLSSPRIMTLNNQKALIRVGEEKKFVSEVTSGSTVDSSGTTTTTDPSISFETHFSGISLVVMPHIVDGESIMLHVHPAISKITEEKKTYNLGGKSYEFFLPQNDIRESDSLIRVNNNQIVVLGGLMTSYDGKESAYLPFLKKTSALDHRKQLNHKSELVILIKPVIVTVSSNDEIITQQREILKDFRAYSAFDR